MSTFLSVSPIRELEHGVSAAQYNLFRKEPDLIPVLIDKETETELPVSDEITLVKSGDASQIILSGYGIFMGKKSERLSIKTGGKAVYEFPFFRLSEIIIASHGIALSSGLIEELCDRGIRVTFLAGGGRPYAMLSSPALSAVVSTRREQIFSLEDERGILLSTSILFGKIRNQHNLLRYFGKHIKATDDARFARLMNISKGIKAVLPAIGKISGGRIADVRDVLMGIEGTSGRLYWEGVGEIIGNYAGFAGRTARGATDAVNALLNYGYGILYSRIWGAVVNAGLEPFAGFLHVDRPGKPSLVLDLIEEFRQPVVDRTIISHINLREPIKIKDGLLESDTRKNISDKIINRLEQTESYGGKHYRLKSIIQMQARNVASFLRGEKKPYRPFPFKW